MRPPPKESALANSPNDFQPLVKKIPTAPQVTWTFAVVRPPPKESALANSQNIFLTLVQKYTSGTAGDMDFCCCTASPKRISAS
ncbi:hypothetical protein CA834_03685 [Winogradskyella aurantia]|uniref:Uncharacterized protein n=1 Tax=Winogradskyella aurantia TaxID=1915063 RepID=A0A265UWQ0_9FLAO|nr:hypothetical protein CA834_03685 [Winogradskyella aurantia]